MDRNSFDPAPRGTVREEAPRSADESPVAPVNTTRSQQAAAGARAQGSITLHFPDDVRIGTLYASEDPQRSALGYAWEEVGPAQGMVTAPAGRLLRLDVYDHGIPDFAWLDRLGPDDLHTLNLPKVHIGDAEMVHVGRLTALRHLDLSDTNVTDEGLAHLKGLTQIEHLNLSGTQVTDAGLGFLGAMPRLETLHLWGTQVTDAGLAHVAPLANLRELTLAETGVTDAGMEHLGRVSSLRKLDLSATKVTDQGAGHLRGLGFLEDLKHSATHISHQVAETLQHRTT